jgi:hypothetical protein
MEAGAGLGRAQLSAPVDLWLVVAAPVAAWRAQTRCWRVVELLVAAIQTFKLTEHLVAACRDAQEAGEGSKWTISAFAEWMRRQGHDFEALWSTVKELVAKTLISVQPMLQYQVPPNCRPTEVPVVCYTVLACVCVSHQGGQEAHSASSPSESCLDPAACLLPNRCRHHTPSLLPPCSVTGCSTSALQSPTMTA